MMDKLVIKRTHGLGNVLLLLPVLEHLRDRGASVHLLTDPLWAEAVGELVRDVEVSPFAAATPETIDLDAMTMALKPVEHRTLELARLLGVEGDIPTRRYRIPESWGEPFDHLAGAIVFAPEATHPARQWSQDSTKKLAERLAGSPLVLTGVDPTEAIPCDADLRGKLDLRQMLGLLSKAKALVSLDSGTLHMATSLGIPSVAIFGGVNPRFRVRSNQQAIVLQADMTCAPCDKHETCDGRYSCLKRITPDVVRKAVHDLPMIGSVLKIRRIS